MHSDVRQCTVMHGTEGAGPAGGGLGRWVPATGRMAPVFRQGQQELGGLSCTKACGSPTMHIAVVSQTEISQAIRPRRWLCGEAAGGKLFKSPCYTPATGGTAVVHRSPSPRTCSFLPAASQLARVPSKAAGGTGDPSTAARPPGSLSSTIPTSC